MTTRTDAHRPSAINPLDYQFVAHDYYGSAFGMDEALKGERNAFRAHMASTGGKFSGHEHGGTCFVCGAAAMYVAKFFHPKSNTYIVTGEDCANKMHMGDARAFRSFRDKVGEVREAAAGKLKAQKTLDAAGLNKAWDIYVAGANTDAEMIVRDIVAKLVKYGSISEKQEAFIARLLRQIADAPAIAAQRAAEKEAALPVPVSTDRMLVQGKVLTLKEQESMYGTQLKMLVAHDHGWKVWGTCPSGLRDVVKVGDRVQFTAAVQVSDKDPKFGFFSRPTKPGIV